MTAAATSWVDANHAHLSAELERVRVRLETLAGQAGVATPAAGSKRKPSGKPMALDALCDLFHLDAFERDVLLLCAGVELDARFGRLCAALSADGRRLASFGIALAAFPEAHWSALAPSAPLRHWRLVEPAANEPLTTSPLRCDERVLHYLTGVSYLDDRLQGSLESVRAPETLADSHQSVAARLAQLWDTSGRVPAVQLCGGEPGLKADIAASAANAIGRGLLRLRASDIPAAVAERTAMARLCDREMTLAGAALLIDTDGAAPAEPLERTIAAFAGEIGGPVAIATRDPLAAGRGLSVRLTVEAPDFSERRASWRRALGPRAERLNGAIDELAARFRLDAAEINAATVGAGAAEPMALWDACREQARGRLGDLARRIEPAASWDDLVLPDTQRTVLRDVARHVRHSITINETWGFGDKGGRGLGIGALFAGASGTGKTMAAEVLANELRLDLYHIDLSQVVSKYIGETEKNLRRIFDAAERAGAILLFDEADALFGKRSEVKDSHDRYANIEVSYLLQRMEAYRGLAILTTNMKAALDPAFLRRLRFVVQFPFPDAKGRAEIWRRVFPQRMPVEGLDLDRLARLNIAGGNIRNIALHAAFLAADEGTPVRMAHLKRAAETEYAKLEKTPAPAEMGGWP